MEKTRPTRGRRPRRSDAETETLMLRAAVELVTSQGLRVGLDQISLEAVIAAADVSRASAYRRWSTRELFLADVVVAIAQDTDLLAEPAGLMREIGELVETTDLKDPIARRELFIEALRRSAGAEVELLATSPSWRNYLALSATVNTMPEGPVRVAASAAITAAQERFNARREWAFQSLATMFAYRPRSGVPPEHAFRLLARTSGALMTGLIVLSPNSTPTRLAPFGSTVPAQWSEAEFGLVSVIDAFLEPDPDADWSPPAIRARLELWRHTAAELDRFKPKGPARPEPLASTRARPPAQPG